MGGEPVREEETRGSLRELHIYTELYMVNVYFLKNH